MSMMVDHDLRCDILVAGGGAAGVPCAIAAARNDAKVILVQDRSVLGGNASSEIRMHMVGANAFGAHDRGVELETEAREGGIVEEIRLENCVRNPQRSASMFDLILFELCRAEENLTLMLNTTVVGVETKDKTIRSVTAERQSTEDRFHIAAAIFIDCTGDGRMAAEAGASFMEGREDREDFDESLAVEVADNHRLGSTVVMQARRHDRPMPFTAPSWARSFSKDDLHLRLYATPGDESPSHEYGYWWVEYGGTRDTIKDNESIRDELQAILLGIWDHVKNGPPGTPEGEDPFDAAHWALEWFGFVPGKRESRRFVGQHVLCQHDVESSTPFDDAIAYGGWPLDLHPPEGVDAPEQEPCVQHPVPYLYDIPVGACVSASIPNLMFAGRNISASHVAFSSTRVMATCGVMGQGVGTAAAIALQRGQMPDALSRNPEAMHVIQQQLLRDDCFLIGRVNEDPLDLAKQARVTASSEEEDGCAAEATEGQTRCVHGERGAPPDRRRTNSQRWMSNASQALPAFLELSWESTVCLREVQLIFDTGLHRHLTLSHHDGYTAVMAWGRPQPETVRDYTLSGFDGTDWVALLDVRDNCQRKRNHHFTPPISLTKLRITVTATHGCDQARILEVRAYA
jgi:ribulose 1,5-bisphosphate synthetase/thiazole synthase